MGLVLVTRESGWQWSCGPVTGPCWGGRLGQAPFATWGDWSLFVLPAAPAGPPGLCRRPSPRPRGFGRRPASFAVGVRVSGGLRVVWAPADLAPPSGGPGGDVPIPRLLPSDPTWWEALQGTLGGTGFLACRSPLGNLGLSLCLLSPECTTRFPPHSPPGEMWNTIGFDPPRRAAPANPHSLGAPDPYNRQRRSNLPPESWSGQRAGCRYAGLARLPSTLCTGRG